MPYDNYALIPHAKEPAVLLLKSTAGWTLPQHDAEDASEINASIKAQLGCDTTVLYCAYDRYKDAEREEQHRIYVLENHSPDFLLPANAHWISKAELDGVVLVVTDHHAVLKQWLSQAEMSAPPYTLAQRLGKLCRALTWGHLLTHLSSDERWEYETAYPYWLRVFLGSEE